MQWAIDHLVELIIVFLGGALAILIANWISKKKNQRKVWTLFKHLFEGVLVRLRGSSVVILLIVIVLVAAILYGFWLHDVLFPEKRLRVIISVFDHNVSDVHQADAWRVTRNKILQQMSELEDVIKIVLVDDIVTDLKESKQVGGKKRADLVIWGRFFHIGNFLEMEPHITLLCSLGNFWQMVHEPIPGRFHMGQLFEEPSVIDLVRKKAGEINDIVLLVSGLIQFYSGNSGKALDLLRKIESSNPDVLILIAYVHANSPRQNWEEIEKLYRLAIMQGANYASAYSNWGSALDNLGKHEKAVEKFKIALKIDPKNAKIYYNLGVSLYSLGKREEAIDSYRIAIILDSMFVEAYNNWGNILSDSGKFEDAMERYKKIIEINPKLYWAYSNWGNVLAQQGRNEEAFQKYDMAIKINPKFAMTYYNKGLILLGVHRYEEALDEFKKAIDFDYKFAWAYKAWGNVLSYTGMPAKAIEKYKKAIEVDPNLAWAYNDWGKALMDLDSLEKSIEKFKKATEIEYVR
jgi:tetratricopeptide (TPR) repeat protein